MSDYETIAQVVAWSILGVSWIGTKYYFHSQRQKKINTFCYETAPRLVAQINEMTREINSDFKGLFKLLKKEEM